MHCAFEDRNLLSNRTFIIWTVLLLFCAVLIYVGGFLTPRDQWPASIPQAEREAIPSEITLDPSAYRAHRHEAGRAESGGGQVGNEPSTRAEQPPAIAKNYSTTTPFQKATRFLMLAAASFGSG